MNTRQTTWGLAAVLMVLAAWGPLAHAAERRPANSGKPPRIAIKQAYRPGTFAIVMKSDVDQTIQISGRTQQTKTAQEMHAKMVVAKPDAKGITTVTITYTRMKVSNPPMVNVDTADPDSLKNSPVGSIYAGLLQAKIVMTVDKDGKVVKVTGLEEMWDNMARTEPRLAPVLNNIKKQMGNQMVKDLVGSGKDMLPAKPVGPGAIWHTKATRTVPLVGAAQTDVECELVGVKGTTAQIHYVGTLKSAGGKAVEMGPGVTMTISNMDLTMDGQMQVHPVTGLVRKNTVKQKGTIQMSLKPPNGQAINMTSNLEGTTTTTTTPLKPGAAEVTPPAPKPEPKPEF